MSDLNTQQEIAAPKNVTPQSKDLKKEKERYFTTKRITYIATLTAITLMFKILGTMFPLGNTMRITLVYFGWMLSAVVLGPLGGAIVGFSTDIMGWFISPTPGGMFNPFVTLGNTLFAFIIGVSYRLPLKNKNLALVLGTVCAVIVCTLGINSAGLYFMEGQHKLISYSAFLLARRIWQPLAVGANLTLMLMILPVIKRLKLFGNIK